MQTLGDYLILKKLAEGMSCSVMLGKDQRTNTLAAIKVPSLQFMQYNAKAKEMLVTEYNVLMQLSHPHIVKMLEYNPGYFQTSQKKVSKNSTPFLAVELGANGDLCELVLETGKLPDQCVRYYFWQLLNALNFVHSKGYAHRDLKPDNLVLDSELNLKLIDFAFAANLDEKEHPCIGTESYMAPEVYKSTTYDLKKTDFFSLGVVLFVLAHGLPPFNNSKQADPYYNLFTSNPKAFWQYQRKIDPSFQTSPALQELIEGLLHPDPAHRFSVHQVLANPWYHLPVDEQFVHQHMRGAISKLSNIKARRSPSN